MVIAKIKLAPGNAGWYDPLTNIHITIANPVAEIKTGMNLSAIKRGLAFGTIILISGSLDENEIIKQVENVEKKHNEVIQTSIVQEATKIALEETGIGQTTHKIVDEQAIIENTSEKEAPKEVEKEVPKRATRSKKKTK